MKGQDMEPMFRGVFSVYETPDEGYHVSFRLDGSDEDTHVPIPGMLVKLAMSGDKLNPMSMVKALTGGR